MRFGAVGVNEMSIPAAAIAKKLFPGTVLLVNGEIGAGKTTLVKAILKELGWKGIVTSPTFTIVQKYQIRDLLIYHLDLYRLETVQERTGFLSDYFDKDAITIVEWPDKLPSGLADKTISITVRPTKNGKAREVMVDEQC